MSQHEYNWGSCPRCMTKYYEENGPNPGNTLKEEFLIGFDDGAPSLGIFYTQYTCKCSRCDFEFKFNYEVSSMSKSKVKLRPLDNRIVVRTEEAAKVSKGGIFLPGSTQEKPQKGEVLAVGPGKMSDTGERLPMVVKVGDVVMFQRWAGNDIKDLGDDLLMLREDEVLGVVES